MTSSPIFSLLKSKHQTVKKHHQQEIPANVLWDTKAAEDLELIHTSRVSEMTADQCALLDTDWDELIMNSWGQRVCCGSHKQKKKAVDPHVNGSTRSIKMWMRGRGRGRRSGTTTTSKRCDLRIRQKLAASTLEQAASKRRKAFSEAPWL